MAKIGDYSASTERSKSLLRVDVVVLIGDCQIFQVLGVYYSKSIGPFYLGLYSDTKEIVYCVTIKY